MNTTDAVTIRRATETDVAAVRELFIGAYGNNYPFEEFLDVCWLKKAMFDDDTLFLVAVENGKVIGTISAMLAAGGLSDLIGEIGRLVVSPEAGGKKIGTRLMQATLDHITSIIQFGFAEGRTAHQGSQKILEHLGFTAIGFEPLKYILDQRESMVLYGRLFDQAVELRRNCPRLIPEIAPLAMHVLDRLGPASDVIVVDDENGYPIESDISKESLEIEELSEQGWSPLLRIERGRVKGRDMFGALSLSHGFFKIKTGSTHYLVARQDGHVMGGLGYTHDPVDQKVRFFELIGVNDKIKGLLLTRAEQIAREDLGALYIEADVNAYIPAIQRTLERMGFMAVAYCPSMVFENVERLDVVRMAKLIAPYFQEDIPLTGSAGKIRDIVEVSMADRRESNVVVQTARNTELFRGLGDGDIYHLARLGRLKQIPKGKHVIRHGESGDRMYIVVSGTMQVVIDDGIIGQIGPGETVGEMALLDTLPRSADVISMSDATVIEILRTDFLRLMETHPRLGAVVMGNLAKNLAEKMRNLDQRYINKRYTT